MIFPQKHLRDRAARALAMLAAALLLCWPALWNRFPLCLSDSTEYLRDGHLVALQLLQDGWATFAETRSEIYSLGILLVDQDRSTWPIVTLHALLTAWILWLVVRSLTPRRPIVLYLGLVAALSAFTSIGWYVSYLTPDILGPVLYLCLFLLVFAAEDLRAWETACVFVIAWWATASHATHLLLAAVLCGLMCLLWIVRWPPTQQRGAKLLLALGVLLLAAGSQIALHSRIYHQASVLGHRPPFLMARALGDGPARLYLQQHCATLHWTICNHVNHLPTSDAAFLWEPGSIWLTSTYPEQQRLSAEELPLVLATLRAYPLAQARASLANFLHQITLMGPQDFTHQYLPPPALETTLPGIYKQAQASRQAQDALPEEFFRQLQIPVIVLVATVVLLLLPWAWARSEAQPRLLALTLLIVFIVPANAFATGVLSGAYARYQGRIAWMLSMAAILLATSFWTSRKSASTPAQNLVPGT